MNDMMQPEKAGWKIRTLDGEIVFESNDPQAVVDEAHRLEKEAVDEPPYVGQIGGTYSIDGDPHELGVAQLLDPHGKVVRGPKKLREPR